METVKERPASVVENKMGVMPVMRLIINMSLPMMFSMFIMALYNIVDSIFVAKLSEDALTAVSLAFPIQNLMVSFAIGTSIGVNALLSKRLGQRQGEEVNKIAMSALFLAFCNFVVFFSVGLFSVRWYLVSQGVPEDIVMQGKAYLDIVLSMSWAIFFCIAFEGLLLATGLTMHTMYAQLAGAVFNIIADPILIFGIGPFPELGIRGAALATVLGQMLDLIVAFFFNLTKNHEIRLKLKNSMPERRIIADIYKVGVPSILLTSTTSVTTYFINIILSAFSSTAIAVYGVYFKLSSFVFMPVFGLTNGMIPIIAYNYGARKRKRIMATIRNALFVATAIMLCGTALFELFPASLLRLFDPSPDLLAIGVPAIRIIACSFAGAAVGITLSAVFQAFGNAVYSMIATFLRQIVVLLPAAYLLSLLGNINTVWWSYLIAEVVSVTASFFFMHRIYKKKIARLPLEHTA